VLANWIAAKCHLCSRKQTGRSLLQKWTQQLSATAMPSILHATLSRRPLPSARPALSLISGTISSVSPGGRLVGQGGGKCGNHVFSRAFSAGRSEPPVTSTITTNDGHFSLPIHIHPSSNPPSPLPPLLLINGWTGTASDWGGFVSLLTPKRDVITYDPRGLGHSTSLSDDAPPQTIEMLADDAQAVYSAYLSSSRSPLPPSIFGTSMGGMLALQLATKIPVSTLYLACTTLGRPPPDIELPPVPSAFFKTFSTWTNSNSASDQRVAAEFAANLLGPTLATSPHGRKLTATLAERFIASRIEHGANGAASAINAQLNALRKFDGYSTAAAAEPSVNQFVTMTAPGDTVMPPSHSLEMHRHLSSLGGRAPLHFQPKNRNDVQHGHFMHISSGREVADFINSTG